MGLLRGFNAVLWLEKQSINQMLTPTIGLPDGVWVNFVQRALGLVRRVLQAVIPMLSTEASTEIVGKKRGFRALLRCRPGSPLVTARGEPLQLARQGGYAALDQAAVRGWLKNVQLAGGRGPLASQPPVQGLSTVLSPAIVGNSVNHLRGLMVLVNRPF